MGRQRQRQAGRRVGPSARPTRRAAVKRAACALLAGGGLLLLVGGSGCAAHRPVPAAGLAPAGRVAAAESLRAGLTAQPAAVAMVGRGKVRFDLGGRRYPILEARWRLDREAGGLLQLRPGLLAPVLTLWIDAQSWSVRLPRERVAFVSDASRSDSLLSAAGLRWLLAGIAQPTRLLATLAAAPLERRGERWLVRGRPDGLPPQIAALEVWLDPAGGIALWSLLGPEGRSWLRVAYHPPRRRDEETGRIELFAEPVDLHAELLVRRSAVAAPGGAPPPPLPSDWQTLRAEEIPRFLERLIEPAEPAPAGAGTGIFD